MANIVNSLTLSEPLAITYGGTNGSTPTQARSNLGLGSIATQDSDAVAITGGTLSGINLSTYTLSTPVPINQGGTAAITAPLARINLGLGDMATQSSASVSIAGGTISGVTLNNTSIQGTLSLASPLSIANGGTGSTTEPIDTTNASNITSGTLSSARLPAHTGDVSSTNGSAVLTLATVATAGTNTKLTYNSKGLVTGGTTLSSTDIPSLDYSKISTGKPTTVAGYGITDALTTGSTVTIAQGGTGATTNTAARTNLGLGTMSTQNSTLVSITGGSIDGSVIADFLRSPLLTISNGSLRTVGGDSRGTGSVDLQVIRSASTQVASGTNSFVAGRNNTASGNDAAVFGFNNIVSGQGSVAFGINNSCSSLNHSFALGDSNTVSGQRALAVGLSNTAAGQFDLVVGWLNVTSSGGQSVLLGTSNTSTVNKNTILGIGGLADRSDEVIHSFTATGPTRSQHCHIGRSVVRTTNTAGDTFISIKSTSTNFITATLVARNSTNLHAAFEVKLGINRSSAASTTASFGTTSITTFANQIGVATPTITIDTTNGGFNISTAGVNTGGTTYWFMDIRISELGL